MGAERRRDVLALLRLLQPEFQRGARRSDWSEQQLRLVCRSRPADTFLPEQKMVGVQGRRARRLAEGTARGLDVDHTWTGQSGKGMASAGMGSGQGSHRQERRA